MDKELKSYLEELTEYLRDLPNEIVNIMAKKSLDSYVKGFLGDSKNAIKTDPNFKGKELDVNVLNILDLADDLLKIKKAIEGMKAEMKTGHEMLIKDLPRDIRDNLSVKVLNFKDFDIKFEKKLLKIKDIDKLVELTEKIAIKDPKIEIKMPANQWPTKPENAIPVVLVTKDKKGFYNAWFSGGGGGGGIVDGAGINALSTLEVWDLIMDGNAIQVRNYDGQMSIEITADDNNVNNILLGNSV